MNNNYNEDSLRRLNEIAENQKVSPRAEGLGEESPYYQWGKYELGYYIKQVEEFFSPVIESLDEEEQAECYEYIRDWTIYAAVDKTFLNKAVHKTEGPVRQGLVNASLKEIGEVWAMTKNEVTSICKRLERKCCQVNSKGVIVTKKGMTMSTIAMLETLEEFRKFLFFKDEYVPSEAPEPGTWFSWNQAGFAGTPFI